MNFPDITKLSRLLLALVVASAATLASAQERPRRPLAQPTEQRQSEQRQGEQRDSVLRLLPANSVTEHSIDIPGGKLAYTATAGTLSLFDQSGERSAAIYYTAYVAERTSTRTPKPPAAPSPSPSTAGPARPRPF